MSKRAAYVIMGLTTAVSGLFLFTQGLKSVGVVMYLIGIIIGLQEGGDE